MSSKYSSEDITILVDSKPEGRHGTFRPGQRIFGRVSYNPRSQVDIDKIEILFKGICFTEILVRSNNTTHHYPEKVVLFRDQENLFRGPRTLAQSQNEWPFQFVLPEGFDYARKPQKRDATYQLGPQPLPPTFDNNCSNPKAKVTYKLKVKVNPGRILHSTKKELHIPVWSVSPSPLPAPQAFDRPCDGKSVFKSSGLRPVQLSLKEKMKHVFGNDPALKTPCIQISVSAKTPRVAGASQPLPIEVSCKHIRTSEVDPEDPVIILDHVDIHLKSYVNVRAKSTLGEHTRDRKMSVLHRSVPGRNARMPLDGSFVELQSFSLADLTKTPHVLVPTFKTPTINMYYKLDVTVHLRHPDIGHTWKLSQKNPFQLVVEDAPNMNVTPAYSGGYLETPLQQSKAAYQDGSVMTYDVAHAPSYAPPAFQDVSAPPAYESTAVWQPDVKS